MSWMDAVDGAIDRIVKARRIKKRGPRWYDDPARVERAQRTGIRYTDDELADQWEAAWRAGYPPMWSYNEYKRLSELDR